MVQVLFLSHLPPSLAHCAPLRAMVARNPQRPPTIPETLEALRGRRQSTRNEVLPEQILEEALAAAEITRDLLVRRNLEHASYWSSEYPAILRQLDFPPWNIFYSGTLPRPCPTLAVVGTRRPDAYGARLVAEWVPALSKRPLQIVSGLAYGIDSLAHHYACESGIPNFAVLGSGPDMLYPSGHAELADRILQSGGGILSELPPGTPPQPRHFPWRNRIISALSCAVWVVQGTLRSGSRHTVEHALAQSRAIIVTPGNVFSELSAIPNRILFDGGRCALQPADIDDCLTESWQSWVNLADQRVSDDRKTYV